MLYYTTKKLKYDIKVIIYNMNEKEEILKEDAQEIKTISGI